MKKIELNGSGIAPSNINHVFVVDVSGSMYDSLPKMRQHLKNNVATMVQDNDTVSIVYFSSNGQHGAIVEGAKVNNVSELEGVKAAIDKFLRPMGCTGFVDPLDDCIKIATKLKNGNINNMIFMTDGYDNQCLKATIIKRCTELSGYFENITFIEYGYYCDRELIAKMAEASNGTHIFSQDYVDYEKKFEAAVQENTSKKQIVEVSGEYVIYTHGNNIVKTLVKDGKVSVPEDLESIVTFDNNEDFTLFDETTKYTILYTSLLGSDVEFAWKILKDLGDVKVVQSLSTCFSKQDFSNLQESVKEMVFDPTKRYVAGKDINAVPDENAFTVLDLLNKLSEGDNYIVFSSPDFNYSRIGKATRQENLGEKMASVKDKMMKTSDANVLKELAVIMSELEDTIEFTSTDSSSSIGNVVYNEARANVSLNTTKNGYITIPTAKAAQFNIPTQIPTTSVKNYTIVKDGIKNMKILPLHLDRESFTFLKDQGLIADEVYDRSKTYLINIENVPMINMSMIKSVYAKDFFAAKFESEKIKAKIKVYKHFLNETYAKSQSGLISKYGEEAAAYLESIGVKDYGFSPKVISNKGDDSYMSKELSVKISGLSSLPAINATIAKKASGKKINLADTLMIEAIDEHTNCLVLLKKLEDTEAIRNFYNGILKQLNADLRVQRRVFNSILYSVIIGKTWFKDFESYDDNSMDFDYNGISYTVTAVLEEKEVSL